MSGLTPEQQASLVELVEAYRIAKKAGKFIGILFMGLLGFIVLLSQAWDAIKIKLGG